jgi:hypothetical protein
MAGMLSARAPQGATTKASGRRKCEWRMASRSRSKRPCGRHLLVVTRRTYREECALRNFLQSAVEAWSAQTFFGAQVAAPDPKPLARCPVPK